MKVCLVDVCDRAVRLTTPSPRGVSRGCLATEPSDLQRLHLGKTIGEMAVHPDWVAGLCYAGISGYIRTPPYGLHELCMTAVPGQLKKQLNLNYEFYLHQSRRKRNATKVFRQSQFVQINLHQSRRKRNATRVFRQSQFVQINHFHCRTEQH